MRTVARLLWYWGPLVVYAAIIFGLSSMSHPPVPTIRLPYADKLLHLIEYAGFGYLISRALTFGGEGISARAAFLSAVGLGLLYGASDELHQLYVPNREASLLDLLADVAGATLGGLANWVRISRRRDAGQQIAEGSGGQSQP